MHLPIENEDAAAIIAGAVEQVAIVRKLREFAVVTQMTDEDIVATTRIGRLIGERVRARALRVLQERPLSSGPYGSAVAKDARHFPNRLRAARPGERRASHDEDRARHPAHRDQQRDGEGETLLP